MRGPRGHSHTNQASSYTDTRRGYANASRRHTVALANSSGDDTDVDTYSSCRDTDSRSHPDDGGHANTDKCGHTDTFSRRYGCPCGRRSTHPPYSRGT